MHSYLAEQTHILIVHILQESFVAGDFIRARALEDFSAVGSQL